MAKFGGYIRSVALIPGVEHPESEYPFDLPAVAALNEGLKLDAAVTFIVGENGSGKSTLIEAIAVAAGFNPEGGTKNFNFGTYNSHSSLSDHLRLQRSAVRERDGFFLRAESMYNVASEIDRIGGDVLSFYGGISLHEQSHGESFMATMLHRMGGHGLYIFDEPEAALSPVRQLACLSLMHQLVGRSSQFIVATHSPIIMGYPGATIYWLSERGIERVPYEETEHYTLTRSFLDPRERRAMLDVLFAEED